VDGYGPVAMHVDPAPEREWAPRALAIDPDHVGPATAAACAVAACGMTDPSDPDAATACIRRGEAAIARGSVDDGLLVVAAMHQLLFGCRLATSPGFIEAASARAAASDDLHRQAWVFAYTAEGERALQAAERLGNVALIALARLSLARSVVTGTGSEVEWAAIEELWDAAEGSSCPILVNHAAQMLGDARIRAGTVIDGLLLLRAPLRDWYLEADPRVWDVLQSVADGLALAGDAVGAARLGGAIGAHRTAFATAVRPEETRARVDATLGSQARRRHERDGRAAGLGAIVAEAVERIEAAARRVDPPAGRPPLTARQREIADLVAGGLTNKQIARALGVSRFTVETHVRNILERLGVASRAQIAVWAATAAHT
jgi:DNA-binding CsgD family transcriptional regulator